MGDRGVSRAVLGAPLRRRAALGARLHIIAGDSRSDAIIRHNGSRADNRVASKARCISASGRADVTTSPCAGCAALTDTSRIFVDH